MINISYQRYGTATFQLRLRFYQSGETKFISVSKLLKGHIQKRHWNPKKQMFIPSCPFSEENNAIITKFKQKYEEAAIDWNGSLSGFIASVEEPNSVDTPTLSEYIKSQAAIVAQRRHEDGSFKGTSDNYLKVDLRFRDFCEYKHLNYESILITELTPSLVDSLFKWIADVKKGKGKGYLSKDLHAIMNRAGEDGYINPDEFKKCDWYKKNKASSQKNNTLTEEQVKKFSQSDFLSITRVKRSKLFQAICMVMLYTGQSPCDAWTIKKSQIQVIDGVKHLVFKRRKLGARQAVPCAVPINEELDKILKEWSKKGKDGYIFPIRRNNLPSTQERLKGDLIALTKHLNVWLKKVGAYLECKFQLRAYTFRHTSITRYVSKNIPVVYLSNMFGTSVDNIEKIYYNNLGDISSRDLVMSAMRL